MEDWKRLNRKVSVLANRYIKGKSGPVGKVLELEEALKHRWQCDAYVQTCVYKDGRELQKRINKTDLEDIPLLQTEVFFADVDNENHAEWTEESLKEFPLSVPSYKGLGIYVTKRGYRLVQPLETPIPVVATERALRRWLFDLENRGFKVDFKPVQWNSLYRLPNIVREGKAYICPWMDLSEMCPVKANIDLLDIDDLPPQIKTKNTILEIPEWSKELPERYAPVCKALAEEVKKITDPWHYIFLGIAGAGHGRGVASEHLPHFCKRISELTGKDNRTFDRMQCGQTTGIRRHNGQTTRGYTWLSLKYPKIAEVFDTYLGSNVDLKIAEDKAKLPVVHLSNEKELNEASNTLLSLVRDVKEDKVEVIKAPPGVGKTHATISIAAERSLSNKRQGMATAISLDKNKLAIQVSEDLMRRGASVKRLYGPMSLKDEDGNYECKFIDVAKHLVEGGISVYHELCTGRGKEGAECEYFESCKAKDGWEGDEHAKIIVSNHAKLAELAEQAGSGILAIDEPPHPLTTYTIKKKHIREAVEKLDKLEWRYVQFIKEYVHRLADWTDENLSFDDLTKDIDLAPLLNEEGKRMRPPPKLNVHMTKHMKPAQAEEIGKISKTLDTLVRMKLERSKVELDGDSIRIVLMNEMFFDVLKSGQRVVVTDANADLLMPFLTAIIGEGNVKFNDLSVIKDSQPMERLLLKVSGANKRTWMWKKEVKFDSGLPNAFQWIWQWHREGNKIGIITFKAIADLIRNKDPRIPEEIFLMNPVIHHYYGSRGLNDMQDADELVTIGDPYVNIDTVRDRMHFLDIKLEKAQFERDLCRAELEQSHGRLRAVRRTKPGRAMHIGAVLPQGYGWDKAIIRRAPRLGGSIMTPEEMKHILESKELNTRSFSELTDINIRTVQRYLDGTSTIPHEIAKILRNV